MKLCYKDYPVKMSLGAIKQFKQKTGLDLWAVLLDFIDVYIKSKGDTVLNRMKSLYEVVDFETGSYLIHALVQAENKSIPLEEIQDAMFRVGWLPNDEDSEMSEPWVIVVVNLAYHIDATFSDLVKKKADT